MESGLKILNLPKRLAEQFWLQIGNLYLPIFRLLLMSCGLGLTAAPPIWQIRDGYTS